MSPSPAGRYVHGHHDSVLRSHRWRTAENSAAYLLARLQPGQRLLDVGCGPGTITLDLARLVAPGHVVAIDPAQDALTAARQAATGERIDSVVFETGDVTELGYADASFDVVHAHQVLQHVVDPVAALREMRRVCRPGGTVAARDADYAAMVWFPLDPRLDRWLTLYQQLARSTGGEPDAGRRLLAWARAASFEHIEPTASVWCFSTPDDRAWWGGLWAERVRASAFVEHARAQGITDDELDEIAHGWLAWSREPDGWFSVVHGEILATP